MIKFLKKRKLHIYIFLGILLLGAFLRFYNYPYRYSLGEETIRDAVIGIEGARQLQFPLTGSFSSLGPFTFGPWYAYQLIIFYLLIPFVYSPWIYLSIISVVYIFIMYKIGKILSGKIFALVLAFLAAISPAQIISATHLTSHNNTNLFAVLSIWIFLILLTKNKSKWWSFLLGFIIGIGMNHHWFTTRNIFFYLTEGKNAIYVPNRWLFYVRDFWPSFWSDALGVPVWFGGIIIILFIVSLIWLGWKKKLSRNLIILISAFLFNFILLRYYWGPRFFGYLNFLRPFVFIFTAFAIINLKYKKAYIGFVLIPLIVFFSYPRTMSELKKDPYSMWIYSGVRELEKKYPNNKFSLYTCSTKYNSFYNGSAFSTLLLLEMKNKHDDKGIKIGLKEKCQLPSKTKKEQYPMLSSIGILDFSSASNSAILEAGWKPLTFSRMYNEYARWWFDLQP